MFKYEKDAVIARLIGEYIEKKEMSCHRPLMELLITKVVTQVDILLWNRKINHMQPMLELLDAIVQSENIDNDQNLEKDMYEGLLKPRLEAGKSVDMVEGWSKSLVFLAHVLKKHAYVIEVFSEFDKSYISSHISMIAFILEKHLMGLKENIALVKKRKEYKNNFYLFSDEKNKVSRCNHISELSFKK